MRIPNLPLSFLTFRIDFAKKEAITVSHPPPYSLNNARIQLESRCRIHDRERGEASQYVLGASCKTERVGVPDGIWLQPNADFCPILSEEAFLALKSWDRIGRGPLRYPPSLGRQSERQLEKVADAFDSVKINLRMVEAEPLETATEIVQATLADELLAGRVQFTAQARYDVTIDFPIKTMNANERDDIYQTDTGPILFPDFSQPFERPIETLRLAYVAYNCPDWAEFILQVPTPVGDGIEVNHYSQSVHLETQNSLFRIVI